MFHCSYKQASSLVNWQHDGQGVGEVRSYLEQVGPLVQRLLHHSVLLQVETKDGLLQVADPSVNQLGAAAARARGEVEAFHQCRAKPCV